MVVVGSAALAVGVALGFAAGRGELLLALAVTALGLATLAAVGFMKYRDPPRHIGPESRADVVIAAMKRPTPVVHLRWVAGNDEARNLAHDLRELASVGEWDVGMFSEFAYDGPAREGVVFEWMDGYAHSATLQNMIDVLKANGFDAKRTMPTEGSTRVAVIQVHRRPHEPIAATLRRGWEDARQLVDREDTSG